MTDQRFCLDGWLVDVAACRMTRDEQSRHLEPKVMKTLARLANRPGEVIPKDELITLVWGHSHVSDAALTRCVFEIRQALGDNARNPRFIETIPKVGYRLMVEPTKELRNEARPSPRWRWLAAASIAIFSITLWGTQDANIAATPTADTQQSSGIPAANAAYHRGVSHFREAEYLANANAITLFRQAIELDPSFGLAYTRLADALTQLRLRWGTDRIDEARAAAQTAVAMNPTDADAYSALGLAQLLDNDIDTALETFGRGYSIDPSHWKSMYNAARAHRARFEYEEAIALLHRVVELAPMHYEASSQLGYLYLRLGETGVARYWLENTLVYAPESVAARRELAILALIERDPASALANCARVLDQLPTNQACLQLAAAAHLELGDTAEARELYETSASHHGSLGFAKLGIARTWMDDGETDAGVGLVAEVLDEALTRIEGDHKPRNDYRLIAGCYAMLGDTARAREWLDRAAAAGRLFPLWDATDPIFANLRLEPRAGERHSPTIVAALP